jgi:rubrerythrin
MEKTELKDIVRKMIQVELDAMHYYRKATEVMQDEGAIFHFSLLADEELEHARSFYRLYPDEDIAPFETLAGAEQNIASVEKSFDIGLLSRLNERQALQLAMKMERELEGNLRRLADNLAPELSAVVLKNAESTLNHYEMIASDYQRLYADAD